MASRLNGDAHVNGSSRGAFVPKQLFGGAITAEIPASFLDASEVRTVPDHQEVFTSRHSRTSTIVEVLEPPQVDFEELRMARLVDEPLGNLEDDIVAMYYHIHDLCKDDGATFEVVDKPTRCQLGKITAPAYVAQVVVTTDIRSRNDRQANDGQVPLQNITVNHFSSNQSLEITRRTRFRVPADSGELSERPEDPFLHHPTTASVLTYKKSKAGTTRTLVAAETGRESKTHTTTVLHFLLVRLKEYRTDILACVTVPHIEYEVTNSQEECNREARFGHAILEKIADTLHVADYSLFVMD